MICFPLNVGMRSRNSRFHEMPLSVICQWLVIIAGFTCGANLFHPIEKEHVLPLPAAIPVLVSPHPDRPALIRDAQQAVAMNTLQRSFVA